MIEAGSELPRAEQVKPYPKRHVYCADPRDGYANIILARPKRLGRAAPADQRLVYGNLQLPVDGNARPLLERIELHTSIDENFVVHVEAKSMMRKCLASVDLYDLEFGLGLPGDRSDGEDLKIHDPMPDRVAASGSVKVRSNLAGDATDWRQVPGELISGLRFKMQDTRFLMTGRQKDEERYYLKCAICQRDSFEIDAEGCVRCTLEPKLRRPVIRVAIGEVVAGEDGEHDGPWTSG